MGDSSSVVPAWQTRHDTFARPQYLGIVEYRPVLDAMRSYTQSRDADSMDQIWLLQHFPVYTAGRALSGELDDTVSFRNGTPLVVSDRGGKLTYHAPGQIVLYAMLDLRRLHMDVRQCVRILGDATVAYLHALGIDAFSRSDSPGVYVGGLKIASIGFAIRHGCCYHGAALNISVDLAPFDDIVVCGSADTRVTRTADYGVAPAMETAGMDWAGYLACGIGLHVQRYAA